jgi:hypothetical protein
MHPILNLLKKVPWNKLLQTAPQLIAVAETLSGEGEDGAPAAAGIWDAAANAARLAVLEDSVAQQAGQLKKLARQNEELAERVATLRYVAGLALLLGLGGVAAGCWALFRAF